MNRSATAFLLLAGLGGCMQAERQAVPDNQIELNKVTRVKGNPKYHGPHGEPIDNTYLSRGAMPTGGVVPAHYVAGNNPLPGDILQTNFWQNKGPTSDLPRYPHLGGVLNVPPQGPPGAVAAFGALPMQMPMAQANARTSVRFQEPREMKVTWYGPNGWNDVPLVTPARYNFLQGGIYRLKLSQIAGKPDLGPLYPTLEVLPATPKTSTFLAHSSVPISFSDDDFEQVNSGNFLIKVVYLPNPGEQDLAVVVGPNELVSTRLEPGVDPIQEAQRRGTILLIIRMGNINLEDRNTPAMDAPSPFQGGPRGGISTTPTPGGSAGPVGPLARSPMGGVAGPMASPVSRPRTGPMTSEPPVDRRPLMLPTQP